MNNTRRDLINLRLRSIKKITPELNIAELRCQEGAKYGLDQTLLPTEPLHESEKTDKAEIASASQLSIKQDDDESSDEETEEEDEEGFNLKSASVLFGAISLSAAALTYLAVSNKK